MLTVACVRYTGGSRGKEFTQDYVRRLAAGVREHLRKTCFQFVCLTDDPTALSSDCCFPGRVQRLDMAWPGWWSKMEAYRLPGPVILFDLDTVIVGDLTPLAHAVENSRQFFVLKDFYTGKVQSGIVAWGNGTPPIFDSFLEDAEGATFREGSHGPSGTFRSGSYRGDGEWLRAFLEGSRGRWKWIQDELPGTISYKVHVRGKGIPESARIVCFHGRPRPHELPPADPVRLAWETGSREGCPA